MIDTPEERKEKLEKNKASFEVVRNTVAKDVSPKRQKELTAIAANVAKKASDMRGNGPSDLTKKATREYTDACFLVVNERDRIQKECSPSESRYFGAVLMVALADARLESLKKETEEPT